jgi:serine/threonine-protein kinase
MSFDDETKDARPGPYDESTEAIPRVETADSLLKTTVTPTGGSDANAPARRAVKLKDPELPARLGRYTLLERLGLGGMAEIFRGEQDGPAGFRKPVVVKRILPYLAMDERFVQMFLREARVAAHLNHPHIIQIYELGEEDGTYFIAMEYVRGLTLQQLAKIAWSHEQSLPVELILSAIADAAQALHYAHSALGEDGRPLSLVHRDISPDNLMIDQQASTKILDFGIAKAVDSSAVVTKTGEVKGKIPFMPPEQIRGQEVSHGSDLYALGVTFYWLLTGARPFAGPNDAALMHSVLHDEPDPPSQLNPSVPTALDPFVLRMLSKDPARRPASGNELAGELLDLVPANRAPLASFVRDIQALGPPPGGARTVPAAVPTTDSLLRAVDSPSGPFKDVTVAAPSPEVVARQDRYATTPSTSGADAAPVPTETSFVGETFGDLTVPRSPPWTVRKIAAVSTVVAALVFVGAFFFARGEGAAPEPLDPPPPTAPAAVEDSPDEAAPPTTEPPAPADAPAQTAPVDPAPVESAPVEPTPVESAPAESAKPAAAPRRARSRTRTLALVAPSSVRWSTVKGAKLGRGSTKASVPAGTRELVATDRRRGVTTRVPVSGDRVDYAKLPRAELDIRAFPYADVFAGQQKLGTAPFPVVKVVAGTHTLRFKHEAKTIVRRVTVAAGKRAVVKVNMLKDE